MRPVKGVETKMRRRNLRNGLKIGKEQAKLYKLEVKKGVGI
jgi:hypothetical protein